MASTTSQSMIGNYYLPAQCSSTVADITVQAVEYADQLSHSHRQILVAVIPRMRCSENVLDRITHLTATQMKFLAEVFYTGLVLARNWGGGDLNTSGSASRQESLSGVDITEEDTLEAGNDPFHELANALGVQHIFGNGHASSVAAASALKRRSDVHSSECRNRQLGKCYVTFSSLVECAHFLPHSVAAKTTYTNSFFWMFLALVVGCECLEAIWEIAGGKKSWRCSNGVLLDIALHKMFDRGDCVLLPTPGYTAMSTTIDVVFCWRTADDTTLRVTSRPIDPEEQINITSDGKIKYRTSAVRPIRSHDRYRFYTTDSKKYPLPHPLLMELHHMLWGMIAAAGLGETDTARKARMRGDRKRKRSSRPWQSARKRSGDLQHHREVDEDGDVGDDDDNHQDFGGSGNNAKTSYRTNSGKINNPPSGTTATPEPGHLQDLQLGYLAHKYISPWLMEETIAHDLRVREIRAQSSSEELDDDSDGGWSNEQFFEEESGSEPVTKSEWSSGEDTDDKGKSKKGSIFSQLESLDRCITR